MVQHKSLVQEAGITTTSELVNAEKARLWLGRNTNNRPISRHHVLHYAKHMIEGRWGRTAQPIQFGENGTLLDGQHRLHALIKADEQVPGLTLELQVARNVPDESFKFIDTGKARTAKDVLALAGYRDTTNLAAVAAAHRRVITQDWAGKLPDNDGVLAHVEGHPTLVDSLNLINIVKKRLQRPALFAALCVHAIERGVPAPDIYVFADSIRSGANLDRGSPALALKDWAELQVRNRRTVPEREYAYVIFRALHAFIHGKGARRFGSSVSQSGDLSFNVNDLAPRLTVPRR